MIDRYLLKQVKEDLERKMVFVGGPRQVGKTTLATSLAGGEDQCLNWDVPEDRENILKRSFPVGPVLVFDEIHKYRQWRNYLKGIYDKKPKTRRILVIGSARLDYYRFGGDSLQGRYHYLRLHPLSFAELKSHNSASLKELLHLGGFPEPFFSGSEVQAKRWSRDYRSRILRDDVRDLERVQDMGSLELLSLRLPELVGSPLSINAIREDLNVGYKSVQHWLQVLERIYSIFRLPPLTGPKIRAVKKEQKHYHFDWTLVSDMSLRFENLVACHLLKWVHYLQDSQGRDIELNYFRDVDKREVDFVVSENRKPTHLIECKWNDDSLSNGLRYLKERYQSAEAWQISAVGTKDYSSPEGIRVAPATRFLAELV